ISQRNTLPPILPVINTTPSVREITDSPNREAAQIAQSHMTTTVKSNVSQSLVIGGDWLPKMAYSSPTREQLENLEGLTSRADVSYLLVHNVDYVRVRKDE
ncbi:hypothetical protein AMTR_s00034p00196660, partial [Amborella trichopoda]